MSLLSFVLACSIVVLIVFGPCQPGPLTVKCTLVPCEPYHILYHVGQSAISPLESTIHSTILKSVHPLYHSNSSSTKLSKFFLISILGLFHTPSSDQFVSNLIASPVLAIYFQPFPSSFQVRTQQTPQGKPIGIAKHKKMPMSHSFMFHTNNTAEV